MIWTDGQPPYPEGVVLGPCVCGSWPGGTCLKCTWIPAVNQVLNLSHDEMRLIRLALERMRVEIDVDNAKLVHTMGKGQQQACRYMLPVMDNLIDKMTYKTTVEPE